MKAGLALAASTIALLAVGCDYKTVVVPGHAPPPRPSSSGSTAVVEKAGRVFAYLPDPVLPGTSGSITVVDVGIAGNGVRGAPARVKSIDLGPGDGAQIVAGSAAGLVAASGMTRKLWFIDPLTDTVTGTLTLDASFGASDLRGPGAPRYVNAIVVDADRGVAYLAVWNGVAVVDLARREVVRQIIAPQAENLGLDAARGLLLAPFYNCPQVVPGTGTPADCNAFRSANGTVITDGLNVILVEDGSVFTYRDAAVPGPVFPTGSHPDAAAVDPVLGAVVIPLEDLPAVAFLDLSRAAYDVATRSFTAPRTQVANAFLEAIVVDPGSHTAFLAESFGNTLSVAYLPTALAPNPVLPIAVMPDLPGSIGPWATGGDPHTTAMAVVAGRPVGLLMNAGYTWVARVDLLALLSLPHVSPAGWTAAEAAPAITFLDARSP